MVRVSHDALRREIVTVFIRDGLERVTKCIEAQSLPIKFQLAKQVAKTSRYLACVTTVDMPRRPAFLYEQQARVCVVK